MTSIEIETYQRLDDPNTSIRIDEDSGAGFLLISIYYRNDFLTSHARTDRRLRPGTHWRYVFSGFITREIAAKAMFGDNHA